MLCWALRGAFWNMYGAVWDLQRFMAHLMWLKEEDILEVLLLKSAEDKPMASLTPMKEAALLHDDPKSQGAQATATCPPIHPEEALQSAGTAGLGEIAADPQGTQRQLLLPPPGFGLPLTPRLGLPPALESGSPPLEDEETLVKIPRGAQLDLTSINAMECHYEMWVISMESLCLSPPETWGWPDTNWEIMDLWIEQVTHL